MSSRSLQRIARQGSSEARDPPQVAEHCSVQHKTVLDVASNMATDFTTNLIAKDSLSWKEWRGDLTTRVLHSDAMHRPHATHNWIQSVTALIALGMTIVDVDDIY